MRAFVEGFQVTDQTRILDVGGYLMNWRLISVRPRLILLNLPGSTRMESAAGVAWVHGDGRRLPFADQGVDLVYSNSVIEHLTILPNQQAFAREIARVGRRYYVQTPNRYFPIEPHYQLPLFQFLPVSAQRALNRRFSLGWREKGRWEDVNLLTAADLRRLFPDAEIHRERVLGLTKSLMAVRR